jgi:hypothetical protein
MPVIVMLFPFSSQTSSGSMAVLYGLPVILGLTTEPVRSSAYKSIGPVGRRFPTLGPHLSP